MTSSNGNIFRVTGPLCGEFTGPGEFPTQRPVTRMFSLICVWINDWVNNREAGDLRRHRGHHYVIVMTFIPYTVRHLINSSREVLRYAFKMVVSLWNLTDSSTILLPKYLSILRPILSLWHPISRLRNSRDLVVRRHLAWWINILLPFRLFDKTSGSEAISIAALIVHDVGCFQ